MYAIQWTVGKEFVISTRRYATASAASEALVHWRAIHLADGFDFPGMVVKA